MSQRRGFNLQPARPAWGIRPPVHKAQSMHRPILTAPAPAHVVIPMYQSLGVCATPNVQPGQRVRTGELVAQAGATEVSPGTRIHASISGEVMAVEPRPVAGVNNTTDLCIVIQSDAQDERHPDCAPGNALVMPPDEIIRRIAAAGIVGLGGALFDTAAKLRCTRKLSGLILNGAECEPYITCDEMLMRERADAVVQGALILMRALDCPETVIAVESDMPEARVLLHDAIDALGESRLSVAVVTAKYPAGGERQLIELITGEEVPASGLPSDIGFLCLNVATAAAVTNLFATGEPLISRIVTIAGECIAEPRNVIARIGTLVTDLIATCGGYVADVDKMIMGGPMMGIALRRGDVPITKATNCIVATPADLHHSRTRQHAEMPCIRCAECSQVCPARLLPQQLLVAWRTNNMEALDELGVKACIECGCCDYVCPSYIPLTTQFIAAKRSLHEHHEGRARAARAQARFEAREQRLMRDSTELSRDLQQQVNELKDETAIDAVMGRIARRDKDQS